MEISFGFLNFASEHRQTVNNWTTFIW